MSDFNSSLPVRTENAGDVIARIADATTPSQQLAVDASGLIGVKGHDAAGNGLTSQVNGAQQALDVGINVAGVQIDPRQVRALTSADVVTADQGSGAATHASPWWVRLTDGTNDSAILASGELKVAVTQLLTEDHNFGAVGANTLRVASQIGNATGAADFNFGAVGAQTLRAAAQIGNATGAADFDFGAVGAQTLRAAAQIGNASGAADFNNGATGAQTLRVAANLAVAGANVSNTNPVPVFIAADGPAGTHINNYKDATAIAAAASDNHDYTVTAGKTLTLSQIEAAASGKAKMEVQIETGVASGVFNTVFVQFNSTANPNMSIKLDNEIDVAAGVRVRVIMTNRDNQAQDLYSSICGTEN